MMWAMERSVELAWVAWNPDDIAAAVKAALSDKASALQAVKAVPSSQRSFENTMAAIERASERVSDVQQKLDFLALIHPDEAIRAAAQSGTQSIDRENVRLTYDRDLWKAATEWEAAGERLEGADRRLADHILRDMRRMGFALPDERFLRLKAITEELSILASDFEKAIADYEDHLMVTRDQLEGLPDSFIARLTPEPDGRYRIGLDNPSYVPFMQYANDGNARRELERKRLRKGGADNMERLERMIRLRQEYAGILGYPTHADFVTEIRMSKSADRVREFLAGILQKLAPAVNAELRDLVDIKGRVLKLEKPSPVGTYELAYWSNRLRKERYSLDSEEVRQHFPAEHVLEGMMDIYQQVLGLRFQRVTDAKLWHPSAELFGVSDAASGKPLGHFILDLYPRRGKYDHYAAFPLTLASEAGSPHGLMGLVCNFPPPVGELPSLLSHYEVETLFHEFGHVMHALLSAGRWQRQNGFGVAFDFIEALSQIFEYWAWDPRILRRISKHYRTGLPLSEELIGKMLASRHFMDGNYFNSQAVSALYDLTMHGQPTFAPVSADALARLHHELKLRYEHMELPGDALYAAGWGHMADYDAGYYGYLWSKVYAADMFTRFAADPLSVAAGARYRGRVLEPGATRDELALVRDFLDREPSDAAFLAELGISGG